MAPILAPAPRLPPQGLPVPHPPARLLSPIRLHDPLHSKSPAPCAPSHKRLRHSARSTRRRRHAHRVDCPFDAFGRPSVFDQPWISTLEMPSPPHCDLADLSQLPLIEASMPASGPVRRRKPSLRSNPLATSAEFAPGGPLFRKQQPPIHRPSDSFPDRPETPPPCVPFDPSRVTFHKLMPVFPRGINPSTPF